MRLIPRKPLLSTPGGSALSAVVFSHSAGLGGAESCLVEIAAALQQLGVDFIVILPGSGPLESAFAQLGVPVRIMPSRPWLSGSHGARWKRLARLGFDIPACVSSTMLLARRRPDLVYSNSAAMPVGAVAARLCRIPHVWHLHEFAGAGANSALFDAGPALSLWVMRRIGGCFVASSEALARHYAPLLGRATVPHVYQPVTAVFSQDGRLMSSPPSVTEPVPPAAKGAALRCLMLGAIEENKNQEEAVRALSLLTGSDTEAVLTLIGPSKNDYLGRLRDTIDTLGLTGRVRLIPHYVTSAEALGQADVVLVCSRQEAFGRVTVEAMKAGLVVVGARSGGTAELIQDGETGLLYRPGDPSDLAAKLRFLCDHPETHRLLASRARAWASRTFDPDLFAEELGAVIEPVARRGRRATRPAHH